MANIIIPGLVGLGLGVGYTLLLRQLIEHLVMKPNSSFSLSLATMAARMLPIGVIVTVGMVWGIGPALASFTGFWLGRTSVLALSFSRRLG